MAGVRGFPGGGRQKNLGLFSPLKTYYMSGVWCLKVYVYVCIYIYIYMYMYTHVYIVWFEVEKKAQFFLPPAAGETPDPCHLSGPEMISYTFRHPTPSDTKHLRLPGGAAGAMDTLSLSQRESARASERASERETHTHLPTHLSTRLLDREAAITNNSRTRANT